MKQLFAVAHSTEYIRDYTNKTWPELHQNRNDKKGENITKKETECTILLHTHYHTCMNNYMTSGISPLCQKKKSKVTQARLKTVYTNYIPIARDDMQGCVCLNCSASGRKVYIRKNEMIEHNASKCKAERTRDILAKCVDTVRQSQQRSIDVGTLHHSHSCEQCAEKRPSECLLGLWKKKMVSERWNHTKVLSVRKTKNVVWILAQQASGICILFIRKTHGICGILVGENVDPRVARSAVGREVCGRGRGRAIPKFFFDECHQNRCFG